MYGKLFFSIFQTHTVTLLLTILTFPMSVYYADAVVDAIYLTDAYSSESVPRIH